MPTFFEEVDASGVVENHIQRVLKLEESDARKVLRTYRGIRQDLVDRLSVLRGDRFSAQQLRGVLAQVEGAISAMNASLSGEMEDAAFGIGVVGVEHLTRELNKFNRQFTGAVVPINLDAAMVAQESSQLLINRMDSSLNSYGQDVRAQIAAGLTNAVIVGDLSTAQVTQKVGNYFLGEEWKLTRIVRTELHNVYNTAKLKGMEDVQESVLTDLQKTLIHPMDARTGADSKHAADLHLIVDIDEPFSYTWDGKVRTFMVPPDRPNDRSILVPFRASWGEGRSGFLP